MNNTATLHRQPVEGLSFLNGQAASPPASEELPPDGSPFEPPGEPTWKPSGVLGMFRMPTDPNAPAHWVIREVLHKDDEESWWTGLNRTNPIAATRPFSFSRAPSLLDVVASVPSDSAIGKFEPHDDDEAPEDGNPFAVSDNCVWRHGRFVECCPLPVEEVPEARATEPEPKPENGSADKARGLLGLIFIQASEVKPRVQRWLWDGRIPEALPTLLVGMQGLGKSQLTCWLAAQVSTGVLGDGNGTVLILSAEDDPETTVIPRLMAVGANLENIRLHRVERSLTFPKDIELLDLAVVKYGATFVVVDPIMAYLDAATDAYKPQFVVT